jgi:hypothetical protein
MYLATTQPFFGDNNLKIVTLLPQISTGSNRYCLDKNYAGVLIIWDRMFGTFEWERETDQVPVLSTVTNIVLL